MSNIVTVLVASLLLQPSHDAGTVLGPAIGCLDNLYKEHGNERGQDIIEKGHNALAEGNKVAAELMFAGGVLAGTCRMFEAGERVTRFLYSGRPLRAHLWVGDELLPAVQVYPASEPEPQELSDYYWMLERVIDFPDDPGGR